MRCHHDYLALFLFLLIGEEELPDMVMHCRQDSSAYSYSYVSMASGPCIMTADTQTSHRLNTDSIRHVSECCHPSQEGDKRWGQNIRAMASLWLHGLVAVYLILRWT